MVLTELGWNEFFNTALQSFPDAGLTAARVAAEHRSGYDVWTDLGELPAKISGKLRHLARSSGQKPVVGDWVVVREVPGENKLLIQGVLPRQTCLSRTTAGRTTDKQILAANIDHVFIVASLSDTLNLRRIERYLLLASQSGGKPSLLLTKTDLCPDVPGAIQQALPATIGLPVHAVCGITGDGIEQLDKVLLPGQTATLLGPSGVGKSTLINRWCNEDWMDVQPVRETDQKGRHTTTHRQMIRLPSGGLIIDTPGMRELQLWEGAEGIQEAFADIEALALQCHFTNCGHDKEPGCAVQSAIQNGDLDANRLQSHRKLQQEIRDFDAKADKRAQVKTRQHINTITKQFNAKNRHREDD